MLKIVIVSYPILIVLLRMFPKLISLNILSVSHKQIVHVFQLHCIHVLCFHQVLHFTKKPIHLDPRISKHLRSIPSELGKLEKIFSFYLALNSLILELLPPLALFGRTHIESFS